MSINHTYSGRYVARLGKSDRARALEVARRLDDYDSIEIVDVESSGLVVVRYTAKMSGLDSYQVTKKLTGPDLKLDVSTLSVYPVLDSLEHRFMLCEEPSCVELKEGS